MGGMLNLPMFWFRDGLFTLMKRASFTLRLKALLSEPTILILSSSGLTMGWFVSKWCLLRAGLESLAWSFILSPRTLHVSPIFWTTLYTVSIPSLRKVQFDLMVKDFSWSSHWGAWYNSWIEIRHASPRKWICN